VTEYKGVVGKGGVSELLETDHDFIKPIASSMSGFSDLLDEVEN